MYNDYWVVGGAKGGAKAGDFMPQRSKLFYVSDTKSTDFQQKCQFKASGKAFSIFAFKFPTAFEFGVSW